MVMAPGGNLGGDAGVTGSFLPILPKFFYAVNNADGSLTPAGQWLLAYTGATFNLSTGIWLVSACATIRTGAVADVFAIRIRDTTNNITLSSLQFNGASVGANGDGTLSISPVIFRVNTPLTITLQVQAATQTTGLIKQNTHDAPSDGPATWFCAIQVH